MAWCDDQRISRHIARYKDTFAAWQDGHAAAERGWIIEATTHAPPRIAVGKAIRNAVLTGVITVIYVRDPT
jgi:hypothetical protein